MGSIPLSIPILGVGVCIALSGRADGRGRGWRKGLAGFEGRAKKGPTVLQGRAKRKGLAGLEGRATKRPTVLEGRAKRKGLTAWRGAAKGWPGLEV